MTAPDAKQPTDEADAWLAAIEGDQHALLVELRRIVLSAGSDLTEEIKWRMPCYKHFRHVCYLKKNKGSVVLGFQQGAHLPDPKGLLDGTGKDMRHVKVEAAKDIDRAAFLALIAAAIEFDDAKA